MTKEEIQKMMDEANKIKESEKRHSKSFVQLEPGEVYFGFVNNAHAEMDKKKRDIIEMDTTIFNTPWGTKETIYFLPVGKGARYYDLMLNTLGISEYTDAIGKIVRILVEDNGEYRNYVIVEEASIDELQVELLRLETLAKEKGWRESGRRHRKIDPNELIADISGKSETDGTNEPHNDKLQDDKLDDLVDLD